MKYYDRRIKVDTNSNFDVTCNIPARRLHTIPMYPAVLSKSMAESGGDGIEGKSFSVGVCDGVMCDGVMLDV